MTKTLAIPIAAFAAFAFGCGPSVRTNVAELDLGAGLWRFGAGGIAPEEHDPLLERVRSLASRSTAAPATVAAEEADTGATPQSAAEKAHTTLPAARHRLGPGDEVDVVVGGRSEFSGILPVRDDGMVVMPSTGDLVRAADMTADELGTAIAASLHPRYLRNRPTVSVVVRSSPSWTYHVFGSVARPGRYDLKPGGVRIVDALLEANGQEAFRSPGFSRVHIVALDGETARVRVIDAVAALRGGQGAGEFVQPGTLIVVPERAGPLSEAELRREHYTSAGPGGAR